MTNGGENVLIKERNVRKKLYKSGKSWVIGGLILSTIMLSMTATSQNVNADSTNTVTDKSVTVSNNSNTTNQHDTVVDKQTIPVKNDQTTQQIAANATQAEKVKASDTTTDTQKQAETANNTNKDSIDNLTKQLPAVTPTANQKTGYLEKDGKWYYVTSDNTLAKGLTTVDNHKQYFDNNGVQAKGQFVTDNSKTYYLDPNSGNAVTGIQQIGSQTLAFNDNGEQVFADFYTAPDGKTYYFDDKGQATIGLKAINGHNYYFDSLGQLKKGFTGVIDGQVRYFDQESGQEVSTTDSQIKEGLTSQTADYTAHNAVHSTDSADFDNFNGYLTASSWYRPKDVLRNGQHWEATTANDFRPIVSVWWPSKQTQVNYLNYMSQMGLIDNRQMFSLKDNQAMLNIACTTVQQAIETKIGVANSTAWLKTAIDDFIRTQPQWNMSSEDPKNDHLQNGALTFVNSPLTPDTNSNFRLLNRTPTNQTGVPKYTIDQSKGGFELLLANDVDNSNPVVQAEQLNWLHYLMNFGSITANDSAANFDGIRVDAVDNVDADLLQIAADYFKAAYGVDKNDATANQHLSILEDWSHNDPEYVKDFGNNQLTMDDYMHTQLIWSLTKDMRMRGTMQRFMDYYLVNRNHDSTENTAIPNYSFVRAHDSEVQTVIAQIISELHPDVKNSLAPTADQLAEAFKIYNNDEKQADKKYTQYNMPSAYAMLLTNKDTVPRVYYGDLYTDDGQYMANKSPYFDAINGLLKSRIKYVAGGQSMAVDQNDILTNVRYGKGAMSVTDSGNADTRTQGIGVIVSNKENLALKSGDTVTLHMGAAHKNQAFRLLLGTTADNLSYYDNDNAPVKYTNDQGDLIFDNTEIYGVRNPQVSGFLAVWVPVGADSHQDARTLSDDTAHHDGKTFHSNAALDSQVIYEGFSNFQAFATNTEDYTNAVIAKNGQLFKDWGITSFQLAPQYRSSTDTSFLDSIIQNGYAFTDRYDLGYGTPTKYGTVDQLRDAIKALHANGIQAIADWVPDQIYNLPGQELATVTRTNSYGDKDTNSDIDQSLYVIQSRGGGKYQAQYGGAFLSDIQKKYPALFETKQISTGLPMDPSQKITEWSGKYFNGSNIQGKGAGYVLKDSGTDQYYKVTSNNNNRDFLPKQLTDDLSETGFVRDNIGMVYYTLSGYLARNTFIQDDNGNYYYFDSTGHLVTGFQNINNHHYFFLPNGIELVQSFLQNADGSTIYFDQKGRQVFNQYITDQTGTAYYFQNDGTMVTSGFTEIDGHKQYFYKNGTQVKGQFVSDTDGHVFYLEAGNGNVATQRFAQNSQGQWFYLGNDGIALTGLQTINGVQNYFYADGHQSKGDFITIQNHVLYTNPLTGAITTGMQQIGDKIFVFDNTGNMLTNQYYQTLDGQWLHLSTQGPADTGLVNINGNLKYFQANGRQVKGQFVTDPITNVSYYMNATDGSAVFNDYFTYQGQWYLTDSNYQLVKGFKVVNNKLQHFDEITGVQTKSAHIIVNNRTYIFDDQGYFVSVA
ncbi:hydrolase [Leuconostoc citreum]|uniref:glycoside hydrolase family 70 protein n=1 Tax=Leuconostoc citreum TaxID=33964 RepID=UPI0035D00BE4|nr:hydrolase [Leuconostoc citreum]